MTFPINDCYWLDTVEFVKTYLADNERLIAPAEFEEKFPGMINPYSHIPTGNYQWAVIHKGMMGEISPEELRRVAKEFYPVFANEVFVIFTNKKGLKEISSDSPHIKSFWEKMKQQRSISTIIKNKIISIALKNKESIKKVPLLRNFAKYAYNRMLVRGDVIGSANLARGDVDYSSLTVNEIKKLMNQRFAANQAYNIMCLWDKIRDSELRKNVIRMISPTDGKKILELGCGVGGNAPLISECEEYVGTELSEVAVLKARQAFGNKPNFKFIPMDAMDLKFDDNHFDIIIATEVIEHLPNPQKMVRESFRVLKPGGKLLISSPNRDSLHLRVNRMLGHSDFKCSIDHVKEYTFSEMVNMLTSEGFAIQDTAGVFLQPYWGIYGMDHYVRHLTDNDPQMVEMLRDLGEKAGAEYAFCFVILASKPLATNEKCNCRK